MDFAIYFQLLTQVNQDIRERNGVIKEKKAFLESETENNKEYEKKIAMADRQAAKLRREFQEQESNRTRLQDEVSLSVVCLLSRAFFPGRNINKLVFHNLQIFTGIITLQFISIYMHVITFIVSCSRKWLNKCNQII